MSVYPAWTTKVSYTRFLTTVANLRQRSNAIRKMNTQYRKMDKATDVLYFGLHDFTEPFDPSTMKLGSNKEKSLLESIPPGNATADPFLQVVEVPDLGDVYFGMPYVYDYCTRKNISLEDELVVLATHGFAHLLGYDHEASMEDFKIVYLFEFDILRKFDWATGRNTLVVKELTLDDGHC
ncbi:hypothetical protein RvY_09204-2 [Ramazzottius varieornatus]|uniref:Uncharacterized protein n=1 Tax=Ramazzottius varieornatus TaxID=947166 RepID=A0A1D1V8H3_RAMVA|nr:hypothetical protein RvY_09204-2 [Ramazzottius varieornatus]